MVDETDLRSRLESLEVRYSYQEQALEELTRSVLQQELLIKQQAETIERLQQALKAIESGAAPGADNEKPPHY